MHILTVCLGNICCSPYAACVLAHRGGPAVEVRSAGLRDKWVGMPAHRYMIAIAAAHGYDLRSHRATQMSTTLLEWADTVLAMDRAVLTELRGCTDEAIAGKLALFLGDQDVADP
ncbi:low molecular weight phosphotyrosine protein phosphatase [Streptomyces sp. NPDC050732]|uniref:arsenate reductase/protein-tyrosine-phosphatase family protein n=1 Tax=Streptomyces sp. NPDC050732 TaxID=3154632 RepID=UPI00343779E0